MKIVLPVTFDIDPAVWAMEYGLTPAEAPADILDVLTRAADGGDLAATIVAGWRMMADHTITVGPPEPSADAHHGGDGCSTYASDYQVTGPDGVSLSVADLRPGSTFTEAAYGDTVWTVARAGRIGDEVHLDLLGDDDPGADLPAVVLTTSTLRGLLAHAEAYGNGEISPYSEDDIGTDDLCAKIVAAFRAAAAPDTSDAIARIADTLALLDRLDGSGQDYDTDMIRARLIGGVAERTTTGPPLTGRCLYCTTPVTFDGAGAWVDDTDGDGCDNPTARHTAVVGETTGPVCRYLDLSTRHLPQTVMSHLSAHDGVTAISTGTGWLVSVPEDPDAHAADYGNPDDYDGVPAALLVVQRYARSLGCDRVLFDRDAPVADLPTFPTE